MKILTQNLETIVVLDCPPVIQLHSDVQNYEYQIFVGLFSQFQGSRVISRIFLGQKTWPCLSAVLLHFCTHSIVEKLTCNSNDNYAEKQTNEILDK